MQCPFPHHHPAHQRCHLLHAWSPFLVDCPSLTAETGRSTAFKAKPYLAWCFAWTNSKTPDTPGKPTWSSDQWLPLTQVLCVEKNIACFAKAAFFWALRKKNHTPTESCIVCFFLGGGGGWRTSFALPNELWCLIGSFLLQSLLWMKVSQISRWIEREEEREWERERERDEEWAWSKC